MKRRATQDPESFISICSSLPAPKRGEVGPFAEPMLPRRSRAKTLGLALGVVILAGLAIALAIYFDSAQPLWIPGAGLAGALVWDAFLRRCPTCRGRLHFRAERLAQSPAHHRLLFECSRCHTVWDSGRIETEAI